MDNFNHFFVCYASLLLFLVGVMIFQAFSFGIFVLVALQTFFYIEKYLKDKE